MGGGGGGGEPEGGEHLSASDESLRAAAAPGVHSPHSPAAGRRSRRPVTLSRRLQSPVSAAAGGAATTAAPRPRAPGPRVERLSLASDCVLRWSEGASPAVSVGEAGASDEDVRQLW